VTCIHFLHTQDTKNALEDKSLQLFEETPTGETTKNNDIIIKDHQEDLVSKLDDQYRHLIDKYEALLSLHNQSGGSLEHQRYYSSEANSSLHHQLSLQEELRMSGQFETSDDESSSNNNPSSESQHNGDEPLMSHEEEGELGFSSEPSHMLTPNKPFCGRLTSSSMSKAEEYSEAETYSSGFSEGIDFKYCNKHTQTEDRALLYTSDEDRKEAATDEHNPLDLSKEANHMDDHFQTTPKYKIIFKEIFQVLKQAHGDPAIAVTATSKGDYCKKQEASKTKQSVKHHHPTPTHQEKPSKRDGPGHNVWKTKSYKDKISHKEKGFEWDSNEYPSLASASVARLKILEESYANVLRKGIKQNID